MFAVLAVVSAWLCAALPVFSQEAYYWTYAQHPDLSYFDHPPMVAWLIWLGTLIGVPLAMSRSLAKPFRVMFPKTLAAQ